MDRGSATLTFASSSRLRDQQRDGEWRWRAEDLRVTATGRPDAGRVVRLVDQAVEGDRGKPWENACSISGSRLRESGVDHFGCRRRTVGSCSAVTRAAVLV